MRSGHSKGMASPVNRADGVQTGKQILKIAIIIFWTNYSFVFFITMENS
jgi:hypothetical protein